MDIGERIEVEDDTFSLKYIDKFILRKDINTGKERIKSAYDYWKIYWGYRTVQWRYGFKKYFLRLDLYSDDFSSPKTIWFWSLSQKTVDGWRGIFSSRCLIVPEPYLEIRYLEGPYCWLLQISCRSIVVKIIMMWVFSFIYPYIVTMISYEYEEEIDD